MVIVRGLKSRLPFEELERRYQERMPQFRAIDGLQQKYYLEDPDSGDFAGLYLWRSREDLAEFSASELRRSIAEAYGVDGEPRIEVYEVLMPLRTS